MAHPSTAARPDHAQPVIIDTSRSQFARLHPVSIASVDLADTFWEPRRQINRTRTIPGQYEHCESTGRIDNFRRASGKRRDLPFQGIFFNDSDIYKWLEAASWALASDDDPAIRELIDRVIAEVAAAQQDDGYLNTYFMFERADERWTNFDLHEMYCAGHLFQAAVAHFRVTGQRTLLDVATRFADYLDRTFGPEEQGKRVHTDGHEEVEMALVELARVTGNDRYRALAQFFVDVRGYQRLHHPRAHFGSAYYQDDVPFREMEQMVGHAVRAVYYTAGAADLYAEAGEPELRAALERLWRNMTERKMYVSGGIGSRYEGEAFGEDYELPNTRAYTETCAAIGSVMWNFRMLMLNGEARYADLIEWTLYNAVLPGIGLDGQSYFYQNPLADSGKHRRQPWFGCACCPPNVARLLAQLPGYFYSTSAEGIWAHLYAQGSAHVTLDDGQHVEVTTTSEYPWNGDISMKIAGSGTWSMFLRIPAWAEGATVQVNDEAAQPVQAGTYAAIQRTWQPGDTIRLAMPMRVRRLESHPYVTENTGRVALARGPILYCLEAADNPAVDLREVRLPAEATIHAEHVPGLLEGVVVLRAEGQHVPVASASLYHEAHAPAAGGANIALTAIPYYAWANRAAGQMLVWVRQ